MIPRISALALPLILVTFGAVCAAEDVPDDLTQLSLESLLQVKIRVASNRESTTREAPGIVTLITADDIEKSGARDMIDVLRLVPGFDFASDVWGTVGPSIRGIYNSGKISFLVDGNEFIDRLYSNVIFGNHFPVDQIQQVEIIRGPGSVLYGGTAEMAVVNIITKKAKELRGATVSFLNGQMGNARARSNLNVQAGKELRNDFSIYGSVFLGQGNRSDAVYTDAYGSSYPMKDFSRIDSLFINSGLRYKDAAVQLLIDRYGLEERDHYNVVIPEPVTDHFYSYILDAKYEYKATGRLHVSPRLNFSRQLPWYINNERINGEFATFYKAVCDRTTASLISSYDANANLNLVGGAEYYHDGVEYDKNSYNVNTTVNLKNSYSNVAAFLQGMLRSSYGNLTVGARYENHSQFGSTFVPRISFTRIFDRFHLKALYSQAFRAPNLESIRFNADIRPERVRAIELEAGYELSKKMLLTANVFDVTIRHPILYVYENNQDNYFNFDRTGSHGLEAEYRYRDKWGDVTLNYSFYSAGKGSVPPYQPIDYQNGETLANKDSFLGIPRNKITLQAGIRVKKGMTINPSFLYFSKRYGYQSVDANGNLVLQTFDPTTLLNLFVLYKDLWQKNLDLGLGVYDLLGQDYKFVASYNSGHAPLPGPTREFLVRLAARF